MSDITFPENYEDEDDLIGNVNAVNIIFDGNGHSISGTTKEEKTDHYLILFILVK